MTNDQALKAYGLFMMAWSTLEVLLEVAIKKELALEARRAAIVTSGLGFKARAGILQSLLVLRGAETTPAVKLLREIATTAKRNTLVHGHVHVGPKGALSFVKADADQKFRARKATFTALELAQHVNALTGNIVKLQELLSITDAELREFADVSLHLASASADPPSAL